MNNQIEVHVDHAECGSCFVDVSVPVDSIDVDDLEGVISTSASMQVLELLAKTCAKAIRNAVVIRDEYTDEDGEEHEWDRYHIQLHVCDKKMWRGVTRQLPVNWEEGR